MLSDDSDTEGIHELTINEHYAKAYEYRKEREELAKLKEKYGSDVEDDAEGSEDSEDDESEDEDGEELTPAVDAAILRTLARIRRKDPSIYEQGKDVFEEEREKTGNVMPSTRAHKDKSKPVTMRQHALASALNPDSRSPSPEPLTHAAEQAALRKETITAFHTAVDGGDSEDDDLLIPREKTKDELEREEEEYRAFLEREVGEDLQDIVELDNVDDGIAVHTVDDSASGSDKKKKKRKKEGKEKTGKQEADQEFLMNYILNRGWIDRSARRLPTYSEITASKKGKGKGKSTSSLHEDISSDGESAASGSQRDMREQGDATLDDDEFEEVADRFESSYNFRFEEPDAATIARYPRNLTSLVRRQDTARKEAREKRKARKEEELLKKKEEVKRLKALKLKDLRAKLEKIGREGGKSLESAALQELDLDGEWDPTAHDRQMADLYADDEDELVDEEKPQWDDDIDVADIVLEEEPETPEKKSKKGKKKKKMDNGGAGADAGGVNVDEMDAEVERMDVDDEEWDGTDEMRKRKLDEYMDELYGLEFNDMVGELPTRFKYTKVEPQSFALTPAEILMATDAELNSYIGIKKYAPYRREGKGKQWDNNRVSRLKELKTKLSERGLSEKVKKRKGKKERMRERATAAADGGDVLEDHIGEEHAPKGKKPAAEVIEDVEEPHQYSGTQDDDGPTKKRRRRHRKSVA
ncbi:KRI1-like family C-terminal-domain-containing protein [Amylocystis lapponica]|nr:KRI1-like family C-terminal-domain-containing protein [Amylocystis lapponica]